MIEQRRETEEHLGIHLRKMEEMQQERESTQMWRYWQGISHGWWKVRRYKHVKSNAMLRIEIRAIREGKDSAQD